MKSFLLPLLMLFVFSSYGQYYYLDVMGTKQTNQQYQLLRNFQYKSISASGFDANDELSKDFILEQTISKDGRQIMTNTASVGNEESFLTSYFENNKVVKTVDSSTTAINTSSYEYDNAGRVTSINSTGKDFDGTFTNSETRLWSYNDKGQPIQMLKIKNGTDTTFAIFKADDKGNIGEEKWVKNKRTAETYYYYYNTKKQITDIVRFSRKAQSMLPDFIFEYDDAGHITQMTQAQGGSANYLIWKYTYNENGLKIKEVVYNKKRELLGRIEYKY